MKIYKLTALCFLMFSNFAWAGMPTLMTQEQKDMQQARLQGLSGVHDVFVYEASNEYLGMEEIANSTDLRVNVAHPYFVAAEPILRKSISNILLRYDPKLSLHFTKPNATTNASSYIALEYSYNISKEHFSNDEILLGSLQFSFKIPHLNNCKIREIINLSSEPFLISGSLKAEKYLDAPSHVKPQVDATVITASFENAIDKEVKQLEIFLNSVSK